MYNKIKSQRSIDSKASDIVTNFLQHNFFQRVFDKSVVNVDKQSQIVGVDIYAELNDIIYLIDIKSQLNYINKPTNTFAVEMEFKARNGKLMQGWGCMPVPDTQQFYTQHKQVRVDHTMNEVNGDRYSVSWCYLLAWLCKCSVEGGGKEKGTLSYFIK